MQISGLGEAGSFTVRPFSRDRVLAGLAAGSHPWSERLRGPSPEDLRRPRIELADSELQIFVNSRFPSGQNDGAVWQGRGLTSALDAGATARWRGLTLSIRPTFTYSQNASFQLAPVTAPGQPQYAYPWRKIDLPQRFGPDPLWALDPGQSELRLDTHGLSVGFGTTNLWWGPSIRNAIVMSNNAPGVPHAFIGTDGPVGIGIGQLEARWIWGDLDQSDWFDPDVARTDRFITGAVATYSPDFLPGLSVGATRVFYVLVPDDGIGLGDYFAVFQGVRKKVFASPENPTGDDEHDQLLSVFGRWVLAESGFEVYGEWARNDHAWDFRDLILQPEHSQAYTLGLQKALALSGNRLLALTAELTHLEREPTYLIRGASPTYYAHHIVTQGYTQKGQVLGSGLGPGGNGQHVAAALYASWGRASLSLERHVRDNDAYYVEAQANDLGFCCNDVSLHLGAGALVFAGDLDLGGGLQLTRELNRYFTEDLDLWNVNLSLSARWRPR